MGRDIRGEERRERESARRGRRHRSERSDASSAIADVVSSWSWVVRGKVEKASRVKPGKLLSTRHFATLTLLRKFARSIGPPDSDIRLALTKLYSLPRETSRDCEN